MEAARCSLSQFPSDVTIIPIWICYSFIGVVHSTLSSLGIQFRFHDLHNIEYSEQCRRNKVCLVQRRYLLLKADSSNAIFSIPFKRFYTAASRIPRSNVRLEESHVIYWHFLSILCRLSIPVIQRNVAHVACTRRKCVIHRGGKRQNPIKTSSRFCVVGSPSPRRKIAKMVKCYRCWITSLRFLAFDFVVLVLPHASGTAQYGRNFAILLCGCVCDDMILASMHWTTSDISFFLLVFW